ncbi:MAG: hypothetical protein M3126_00410 [Candidatus Eremiobacteraeota bacterium]|nr:hypothetical protein [Candidatus Eremiobacteraeota bacterium]
MDFYMTPRVLHSYIELSLYDEASGFVSTTVGDLDDCAPGDTGGNGFASPFAKNC